MDLNTTADLMEPSARTACWPTRAAVRTASAKSASAMHRCSSARCGEHHRHPARPRPALRWHPRIHSGVPAATLPSSLIIGEGTWRGFIGDDAADNHTATTWTLRCPMSTVTTSRGCGPASKPMRASAAPRLDHRPRSGGTQRRADLRNARPARRCGSWWPALPPWLRPSCSSRCAQPAARNGHPAGHRRCTRSNHPARALRDPLHRADVDGARRGLGHWTCAVLQRLLRSLRVHLPNLRRSSTTITRTLVYPWGSLALVSASVFGAVVLALLVTTRRTLAADQPAS